MSEHMSPYSMLIEWSNLDNAYVVSFPEWERAGYRANTHGATYAEAAQKGQELLESLVEWAHTDNEAMPEPNLFDAHAYQPGETAESIAHETQDLLNEITTQNASSADPNMLQSN